MTKKNLLAALVCFGFLTVHLSTAYAIFDAEEKQKRIELETEVQKLKQEIANTSSDRDNLLKQAQAIQVEKESLLQKIVASKNVSDGAATELDSLKKENKILKSESEKIKIAREKDLKLYEEQKSALERKVTENEARAASLALTMKVYTPDRIETLVQDRNRLEEESKRMAQRVFELEKRMEEVKRQMTPLELDRAELRRIQQENRELQKKSEYIPKLEKRQEQLIAENAEYREKASVLKSKFKEATPGLAKSNRISQKMMRENADMHFNLGSIFLQNKQYKEAVREYERVLELRPSDPETHYNLGVLYDDYLKERDKALYHYQKYLAVNPKATDAKKVESYMLALELEQKVR